MNTHPPTEAQEELLEQILNILDTSCQASLELLDACNNKDTVTAYALIADLREVIHSVQAVNNTFSSWLEHAYTTEGLENVIDTLDDIQSSLTTDNIQRACTKAEFQLYPFLCLLWESYYFWITVYPDSQRMDDYYKNEFAQHYANPYISEDTEPQFQLSIVIPVYNHLDMTKQCVEQLLKVTDLEELNAELIFIDHGSSDGSLEYLESLGIGKVIHFKRNNRMYVFCVMAKICRSKYLAYVSNDVLVTEDWAKILIQCMDSDPQIIAAVPATPNISNYQAVYPLPNEPNKFIQWAATQNSSDSSRWDERSRLMPPLGCYRMEAVNKIGFADPYLYTMEFWDDDFSLRARRNGYRQLVCHDVACYHFGHVTGGNAQKKENTLQCGRELFKHKNHVDPWKNGFCYDLPAVKLIADNLPAANQIKLLGIDCGFGDTPLQIRNELRHQHKDCYITNITCQNEYISDLRPLSDTFYYDENIQHALTQTHGTYDCIYLSREISEYSSYMPLIQEASNHLTNEGVLIFTCANPYCVATLYAMLTFSLPQNVSHLCLIDPIQLNKEIQQVFSNVHMISKNISTTNIEAFVKRHYGDIPESSQLINRLSVEKYYFVCKK